MQLGSPLGSARAGAVPLDGLAATLRDPARAAVAVLIEALSETTATLRTEGALPPGTPLRLPLPGVGPVLATVTHQVPHGVVAAFAVPLDAKTVVRLSVGEPVSTVAVPQRASTEARPDAPRAEPRALVPEPPPPLLYSPMGTTPPARVAAAPPEPDSRALWLGGASTPPAGGAPSLPRGWIVAAAVLLGALLILLL